MAKKDTDSKITYLGTASLQNVVKNPSAGLLVNAKQSRDSSKPGVANPRQFTENVLDAFRRMVPGQKFEINKDLEIIITDSDGVTIPAGLQRLFFYLQAHPDEETEIIRRHVLGYRDACAANHSVIIKSQIIPVIKWKDWAKPGEGSTAFFEPYNEELLVAYAVDAPTFTRYLNKPEVAGLGLPLEELRKLAYGNLERILPPPQIQEVSAVGQQKVDNCFMIECHSDYTATLILFKSIWPDLQGKVHGELLIALLGRHLILATGSQEPGGVEALTASLSKSLPAPLYPVSRKVFVYREEKFEVYTD